MLKAANEVKGGKNTYTSEIGHTDLDSHAGTSLVAPCQVVGHPADDAWERRIERAHGDKDTAIDDLWIGRADGTGVF